MRRLLAIALVLAASHAAAQGGRPPGLEPLPEPPPPPALREDGVAEPAVRITPNKEDKVEKAVVGGRAILKVTPPGGRPYYLVEGPGGWQRREALDDGTRVPMWTIFNFD
ncbi:MAG: DUF2782 domain-containing protein [Proteobacteria bacterium]|nr:DUF2782 domain-containing protein [Pseudomonadota bacterium]